MGGEGVDAGYSPDVAAVMLRSLKPWTKCIKMRDDIAVVGWACRLPGANSIDELWTLLQSGRCSIGQVPADRFPLQRFGHPQRQERGRSYSWAAGTLDHIW